MLKIVQLLSGVHVYQSGDNTKTTIGKCITNDGKTRLILLNTPRMSVGMKPRKWLVSTDSQMGGKPVEKNPVALNFKKYHRKASAEVFNEYIKLVGKELRSGYNISWFECESS